MRALSASELLSVWELGLEQAPAERALALLATACGVPPAALAGLPIGQRDAGLLTLREWTFGPRLSCHVTCPGCSQQLEISFDAAEIRTDAAVETECRLTKDGYDVRFRPPNCGDLVALAGESDPGRHRQFLFERCLLEARHGDQPVPADALGAEVVDAMADGMAQADPQADVRRPISCAACGQSWRTVFDIGSFFWIEIDAWARRILREVHALASAYGWAERDILALSPRRRQLYLEMVGG
jgi:hypothetical protein